MACWRATCTGFLYVVARQSSSSANCFLFVRLKCFNGVCLLASTCRRQFECVRVRVCVCVCVWPCSAASFCHSICTCLSERVRKFVEYRRRMLMMVT